MSAKTSLPENAFRPLREGERYTPILPPGGTPPEANVWSVAWGLVMAIIFSAATAYLGLKVGQVFEAAIPITIIAVGLSGAARRRNPLGENVIIQSIGACSGMITAGAIFTLPALYILQTTYPEMTVNLVQVFLASALGGVLGILFLIPFRRYFVRDMHGRYPFPEATASTQVLLSAPAASEASDKSEATDAAASSGGQTRLLLLAGAVGGAYDFCVASLGLWAENFTSRACALGETVAAKAKLVLSINTGAALLGMGYIVGLKYAAIICAGSAAVWWVIVPALALLFPDLNVGTPTKAVCAAAASPEELFGYAKSIGIGGIAAAGLIGIYNSRRIIANAFALMGKVMRGGAADEEQHAERTDRDLPMRIIAIGSLVTIALIALFFFFDVMHGSLLFTIVGIVIVAVIAFLFTTVAANAIAIVGSNPVSGMTLMTLILSSVIMVLVGLKGTSGMVAALIMGGVVCTALSSAGAFVTDLKIGYWLGSTPRVQERYKFLGILVSAATVAGVIMILNQVYGFRPDNSDVMAAPQARAMAGVIEPLMNGGGAPWLLYGIGAVIALVLNACGISALAFALGMFIPLQLNLPLLAGGLLSHYISHSTRDAQTAQRRGEKGTLLASGFIAGGALLGVAGAGLQFAGIDLRCSGFASDQMLEWLSLAAYAALIAFFVRSAKRA